MYVCISARGRSSIAISIYIYTCTNYFFKIFTFVQLVCSYRFFFIGFSWALYVRAIATMWITKFMNELIMMISLIFLPFFFLFCDAYIYIYKIHIRCC